MMKLFSSSLTVLTFTVILFGCSEGNYTPPPTSGATTVGQPGYVNPNYGSNNPNYNPNYNPNFNNTNNGMPCTSACTPKPPCPYTVRPGVNPYLAYNPQQLVQMNAQANFQLQLRLQSNAMWSYSSRVANPDFYILPLLPPIQTCVRLRAEPTYAPNSCACVKAPCHCDEILKSQCKYIKRKTCKTCVKKSTPASESIYITIDGGDAEALFKRLAVTSESIVLSDYESKPTLVKRTGINYECTQETSKSGSNSKASSKYVCDLDISNDSSSGVEGVVLEMSNSGKSGTPDLQSGVSFSGDAVRIASSSPNQAQNQADEGTITLKGDIAAKIYASLSLPADGSVTIRTGQDVKCTSSIECSLTVDPSTGSVIHQNSIKDAKEPAPANDQIS